MATFDVYGEVGDGVCTVAALKSLLDCIRPGDPLEIHIFSDGGDALTGFGLYNLIAHYKGPTVAIIDGVSGSAATMPMVAAKRIKMHRAALLYLHLPWLKTKTDIDSADRNRQILEATTKIMVDAYRLRSGRSEAEVLGWMKSDRLWSPDEALAMGLIDEIIEAAPLATQARARMAVQVMARLRAAPQAARTCADRKPKPKAKGTTPMDEKTVLEKLGLQEGASADEIKKALIAYCGSDAAPEDKEAVMTAAIALLGKEPDGDEQQAKAKAEEEKADEDAENTKAKMQALMGELKTLQANRNARNPDEIADAAIRDGRWPEAQRDILTQRIKSGADPERQLFPKATFAPRSSSFTENGKPTPNLGTEEKAGVKAARKDADDIWKSVEAKRPR